MTLRAPLVLAILLAVCSAVPARAQAACEPGRGPSVKADDLREMIANGEPVVVPAGAIVVGAIDRTVLCPGVPDDATPCIVPAPIKLPCTQITAPLALRNVVIDGEFDLAGADLAVGLSLESSEVLGDLALTKLHAGGDIVLDHVLVGGATLADRAVIEGRFAATGLRSIGGLSLEGTTVARGAEIRGSAIGGDAGLGLAGGAGLTVAKSVALGAASVRGLRLSGSVALEDLALAAALEGIGLEIAGDARLTRVNAPDGVVLGGAFRRDLTLDTVRSEGGLTLDASTVDGNLVLLRCVLGSDVSATNLTVGKTLRVEGSDLAQGLDLSGSTIAGELVLISSRFGATVEIGDTRLTARPRVVACTPASPFGEEEEPGPQPIDEGDASPN